MGDRESFDPSAERRIVQDVVDAIHEGRAPPVLAAALDDFERLLAEGNDERCLASLLSEQSGLTPHAMMVTIRKALQFLTNEVARFAEIKTTRPLTDEEKNYGRHVLIPLLTSTESLLVIFGGKSVKSPGAGINKGVRSIKGSIKVSGPVS